MGLGPEAEGDHDTFRIRYLINPETGNTANLGRLEDDTQVSQAEVEGWERDLGCTIPKPWDP